MELVGIDNQIDIASLADIPSKGSGLGSSSSYTVGLLNALYAYRNEFISKEELARQACKIEIDRCGEPIGKQDQYAAAFGGLNLIRFHPDESVSIDPVICKPGVLQDFENNILVFFTGRTRSASTILDQQSKSINKKLNRQLLRRMVNLAFEMKYELESGRLEHIGEMLNENWQLKAKLTAGITDPQIDEWYSRGLANGACGGKLLGAGNGGFLMFYAHHTKHQKITDALSCLEKVKFRFDRTGTQIVFYHPAQSGFANS
jgi:D-glycero-alpha-D-manno-heptose-7-phosphate kinase